MSETKFEKYGKRLINPEKITAIKQGVTVYLKCGLQFLMTGDDAKKIWKKYAPLGMTTLAMGKAKRE